MILWNRSSFYLSISTPCSDISRHWVYAVGHTFLFLVICPCSSAFQIIYKNVWRMVPSIWIHRDSLWLSLREDRLSIGNNEINFPLIVDSVVNAEIEGRGNTGSMQENFVIVASPQDLLWDGWQRSVRIRGYSLMENLMSGALLVLKSLLPCDRQCLSFQSWLIQSNYRH